MSRTFRRKNYEVIDNTSWSRQGCRKYGYGAVRVFNSGFVKGVWYCYTTYRAATEAELDKEYYRVHGDSHRNQWSPHRSFRAARMRQNRSINRCELHKWITREEYEPLFEEEPRSCMWDWQ